MNTQKFINILDQKGIIASDFFEQHGRDIFINDKLLLALIKEEWGRKKWLKFIRVGWIIGMEIRREYGKEKTCFDNMLPIYRYFSDYMDCCCSFFGNKQVPFEEWEDLAKEQVDILKTLVEKNQLKSFRRTKLYLNFCDKYDKREEELVKKGYGQLWDGEYQ